MSNFLFLKKTNTKLYKIISEAEKLFKDEYFEQSIVQIRCYAENLAKDLGKDKVHSNDTFDTIIQKLKDNSFENVRMQELTDDLYFIKNIGNKAAHEGNILQNGKLALECLERAFEIAIFYSHIKNGYDEKLDKMHFSEELLMTGKISKNKTSLKENYINALNEARTVNVYENTEKKKVTKKTNKTSKPYKTSKKTFSYEKTSQNFNIVKFIFAGLLLLTITAIVFYILKL